MDLACCIDGWLSRKEAEVLWKLARNADGPIVEIGSYMGRSTAALALGAAAGMMAQVYAVDAFVGPDGQYRTSLGNTPTKEIHGSSPELLRANLDAVGVNGQVEIVPLTSRDALRHVPDQCALLFVDGAHDYESVCTDLDLYMPRVKLGGYLVMHDVHGGDPQVIQAVEDKVLSQPNKWRMMDHVDSASVVRRVDTERRSVTLLCPGRGYNWGPLTGIVQSTMGAHRIDLENNSNGWDDFTTLWARALNKVEAGFCTHVAMLHSDITPQAGWIDILMDELEERKLDMVSVACATKDSRGVCNGGIGHLQNRWGPYRRITVRELQTLPPTFGLGDLAQRGFCGNDPSDKVLLHNTGCWVADLRSPVFTQTYKTSGRDPGDNHCHEAGDLMCWFDFPTRIRRDAEDEAWISLRESEDWFFSRQLAKVGAKTMITRKVSLNHEGGASFRNDEAWGRYEFDEDTRNVWDSNSKTRQAPAARDPGFRKESK
jgi:predicted O-methyltransferase YrrM